MGLSTVYIGTHWLSDVVLGWIAGLLILLALPWFEPLIARAEERIFDLRARWRDRRRGAAPSGGPVGRPGGSLTAAPQAPARTPDAPAPAHGEGPDSGRGLHSSGAGFSRPSSGSRSRRPPRS